MRHAATGLLGRERELAEVHAFLRSAPLLTLGGVGGVGKTRLAHAAAEQALDSGARADVCELSVVSDPSAVPFAVAGALGYPSLDAAVVGLGGDARLLVVDNCEHVLDAAAEAVARLVERCPGVTVLATSREALGLPEEQVLVLGTLALPTRPETARDSPRSSCCSAAPPPPAHPSTSTATLTRSSRCAIVSTGYRWPSS